MKSMLCLLLISFMLGCTNEREETKLIRDYSDQPTRRYSFSQWQKLGFEVWKEYYAPCRWEAISKNHGIIKEYVDGTNIRINYLTDQAQEKGISVDSSKLDVLVSVLDEKIVPVHNWFWFDRKERYLFGVYRVMIDDLCLGTTLVNLPATE